VRDIAITPLCIILAAIVIQFQTSGDGYTYDDNLYRHPCASNSTIYVIVVLPEKPHLMLFMCITPKIKPFHDPPPPMLIREMKHNEMKKRLSKYACL
jgi:hypothetical protein